MTKHLNLVILLLVLFFSRQALSQSKYIHNPSGAKIVIVFVHGVMGDSIDTWTSENGYWPEMLANDSYFSKHAIFTYGYQTSYWAELSIDELAENMRLNLKTNGITNFSDVVFLVHSMGGLVTRAYLLKNRDLASKVKFIYFYSTPTTGSQVASIASLASDNPQFSQMKLMDADSFLADQLRQWLAADFRIPSYCAYEKKKTHGKMIVEIGSSSVLCTEPLDPMNYDHIQIVKPLNKEDQRYLAFKSAFQDQFKTSSTENESHIRRLEEILRKLNATQMMNADYLFPQMQEYINNPNEKQWQRVKYTARQLLDEINSAVREAMKVDAMYFDIGRTILQVSDGAVTKVDERYTKPFEITRREWNGRAYELQTIIDYQNLPNPTEVKEWQKDMLDRFKRLENEMRRLVVMLRDNA